MLLILKGIKDRLSEEHSYFGLSKHWISIVLVGCRSNRSAIGARIHMKIIENGKPRSVFRQVNSGGSFGCNPWRQYPGLGNAERIETVQIYWPTTDRTQTFYDLAMDQWVWIVEDEKQVKSYPSNRMFLVVNSRDHGKSAGLCTGEKSFGMND